MADTPACWDVYFATGDVVATLKKAESRGENALAGPIDVPGGGRIGVVQNPQGAVFKVIELGRVLDAN